VWFIRHARSIANVWDKCVDGELDIKSLREDERKILESAKGYFDRAFIDVSLCHFGESQSIAARSIVEKLPLKYVIVSPLKRALQTAKLMFETHPNRKNMKFIVNPHIRELIMYPDAIPSWTLRDKAKEYENCGDLKFDFGMIKPMEDHSYFLETMDPKIQKRIKTHLDSSPKDKYDEALLDLMIETYQGKHGKEKFLESYADGRRRAKVFLDWLKNFIEEKQAKEGEIAVVTHVLFLQSLAAKDFDRNGRPIYPEVENATPFEIDINEVLKYY